MVVNSNLFLMVLLMGCLFLCSSTRADIIHDLVKNGELVSLKNVLEKDSDLINKQDDLGKTPLHHAIEFGNTEIAYYLINEEANINIIDNEKESPLHYSASKGFFDLTKLLLEKGSNFLNEPNAVKHNGFVGFWTPLHLASFNGYPDIVNLLLEYGADIEVQDGIKRTPLILSAESKNIHVVHALVERGADINAKAIRNYTALLWAARNGNKDIVDYLIEQNAAIEDESLMTAFDIAVNNGMEKLYALTLNKGIDIEEIALEHQDFIFPAVEGGSKEIIESFVANGFVLDQLDKDGWSLLHYAASEDYVDIIKYLVNNGLAIDSRTKKGETAYNIAYSKGFDKAAEYLQASGCDTKEPLFPIIQGAYMGQKPPGDTPQLFMPGIVSGRYQAHSSIIFSPDGKEAYWTEMSPHEGAVRASYMTDNRWSYPIIADIDRDPSFSPDGNRIYFIKTRPFKPGEVPGGDPDVKEEYWYMERVDSGWSKPKSVGDAVNAIGVHWPCSIDKDGNLYFSEFSKKMYCSIFIDGEYQEPVLLTTLFGNPTLIGRSPFISPAKDYLLFSSDGNLHISFRNEDETWTDKINLGSEINASHVNGSPRITADGKYLFFLSAGNNRPWGIYWVSADVINQLK